MATCSPSSLISHTLHSSLCSNSRQYKSSPPQHALSFPTTSLMLSSIGHKSLCPSPLRYNNVGVSGINPKRLVGRVKASMDEDTNKNIAVLNKDHLAVSLAKYVADLSNQFIQNRHCFTLVLSAHSVKYLRKLVEPPYINSVEWSKWHIFWVDERVVPKTHVDSNYKLAYDRFLSKVPIPARNINTIDDSLPADGIADAYEITLRHLVRSNVIASSSSSNSNNGLPKFDLILLDMGTDGHVGSLFPGHPALNDNKHWITFLNNAPYPPRHRITMTLPVINACSNLAMVVTGAGKANAVHSAVMGKGKLSDEKLPVQLVKPHQGEMKWFLDKGAASKLYNY